MNSTEPLCRTATLWSGPTVKIFSAEPYVRLLSPRDIVSELSEAIAIPSLFMSTIWDVTLLSIHNDGNFS